MTDIIKLVADITAAQAEIGELEDYIKFRKAKIAELLGEGEETVGDNERGYAKVNVYRHKTFNEGYGKSARPDLWEKAAETKKVVTSASAKAALSAEEYAVFQKPSADLSVKIEVL